MHDIADRLEVGVLAFEIGHIEPKNEIAVDMRPAPFVPAGIEKLIIRDENMEAESGIRLTSREGKVITVAANAFLGTPAVGGVRDDIPNIFDTEYEIDKYQVVPL